MHKLNTKVRRLILLKKLGVEWPALVSIFALLIVGVLTINPYGGTREGIWVTPKWTTQLAIFIPLLLIARKSRFGIVFRTLPAYQVLAASWIVYLGSLGVSAVMSREFVRSIFGYPAFPEGAIFYGLILTLFALCVVAGQRSARLTITIAVAVIVIGVIATLAAIPQKFNWLLDYTVTSGTVNGAAPGITWSGVYSGQMPISLSWHRGFLGYLASLAYAVAIALYLLGRATAPQRWMLALCVVVTSIGVVISDTRTFLFCMCASGLCAAWLLLRGGIRAHKASLITILVLTLVGLSTGIIISAQNSSRSNSLASLFTGGQPDIAAYTNLSGRGFLWSVALSDFLQHPWLGSGPLSFHDALGRAQIEAAITRGSYGNAEVVSWDVTQYTVVANLRDGSIWEEYLIGSKPHNALVEHLHSTGLLGLLSMAVIVGTSLILVYRSTYNAWVLIPMVTWLMFSFFWYESVQVSVLHWALLGSAVGQSVRMSNPSLC